MTSLARTNLKPADTPWHRFVIGATRPSGPALLGTLLTCALLFGLGAALITPRVVAQHPGHFATWPKDEYAFLTSHALHVASEGSPRLSVTVIGDSSTREAISSPDELSALLGAELGRPVDAHVLTAGGLHHYDEVALVDLLQEQVHGLILVQVSPYFLRWSRLQDGSGPFGRLGFTSAALDAELRRAGRPVPYRVGNYFLDSFGFFASRPRILVNVLRGPFPFRQHLVEASGRWSKRRWMRGAEHIGSWQQHYVANSPANFDVYARIIARARTNPSLRVGLLDTLFNPESDQRFHLTERQRRIGRLYKQDLRRFAEANGVPLIDVSEDARFTDAEFLDYAHLDSPDARRRFTAALAKRAAQVLPVSPGLGEDKP